MVRKSGEAQVLDALKQHGPQTARDLARRLGTGPVVVRAHLRSLLARGLVAHETSRQRVGRPTRRFHLTSSAANHFPHQYARAAVQLAEAVVAEGGPDALERTLARWEDALHARLDADLPREPASRLLAIASHQSRHGFMATGQADAGAMEIVERNCPIAELAVRHPEICRHEAALFSRLLGRPVTIASCQALGDSVCRFCVSSPDVAPTEDPSHAGVPA